MGANLSDEQRTFLQLAKREGYLILLEYDPERYGDRELEWWTCCEKNSYPFVKVELCELGATVEYSLRRLPDVTHLTDAEVEELLSFGVHARGAQIPQCFEDWGRIGFIDIKDAREIARRTVEFCRAGIAHWRKGATTPRFALARRPRSA
jgi:hypothetical protein